MDIEIRRAGADDLETARRLIEEYVDSLGIDLGFQEIDRELAEFPGAYSPPGGCIVLAFAGAAPAGCVAVRPLEDDCCEMKRLYVQPAYRGHGTGRALAVAAIEAARELGYGRMRLDTQPEMDAARGLYRSLGFGEIEAYRYNPTPGTAYMELDLRAKDAALG